MPHFPLTPPLLIDHLKGGISKIIFSSNGPLKMWTIVIF